MSGIINITMKHWLILLLLVLCVEQTIGFTFPRQRITRRRSDYGSRIPPITGNGISLYCTGESNDNKNNGSDSMINEEGSNKFGKMSQETKDDIKSTIVSFTVALFVRLFLIEPRYIPSLSMFPTFDIGDQLLVDKISHISRGYQRRDVVVFNPPQKYIDLTGNTEALIKRVVAIAGDTVEVKNNRLYVNNVVQEEAYTNELPDYALAPLKVPQGMLLVLGDNRNHSFDSHVWGFLPEKNVIGRAVLKYWPLGRVGAVEGSS